MAIIKKLSTYFLLGNQKKIVNQVFVYDSPIEQVNVFWTIFMVNLIAEWSVSGKLLNVKHCVLRPLRKNILWIIFGKTRKTILGKIGVIALAVTIFTYENVRFIVKIPIELDIFILGWSRAAEKLFAF